MIYIKADPDGAVELLDHAICLGYCEIALALTRRGVRPDRGVQLVDLERPVPPWWVWREYEWEGRWEWP